MLAVYDVKLDWFDWGSAGVSSLVEVPLSWVYITMVPAYSG